MKPVRALLVLGALAGAALAPAPAGAQTAATPELPRAWLDTTYAPPSGRITAVPAGGNLQAALDAAQPGDTITLVAGATYTGNFRLPAKAGAGWIVVRTAAPDASLPPPGTRVGPADVAVLARVVTPNGLPAIATVDGAHHYRLLGLEITMAPAVTSHTDVGGLVQLGSWPQQTTLAQVPHDIILDRVYVHGSRTVPLRRGIALNSASTAVIDSYVAGAHHASFDTQAICGWNGPGPFKIVNNYLEAAGENVMLGGADPSIPNLVPSDVEIRRNHFAKPLEWYANDPSYGGIHWAVKNLFELKNAQRVLVDGNVFERNWADAQDGYAILFTVRQGGQAPWSVVQDVTFTRNVLRHSGAGVNIQGIDTNFPSQQTHRVLIKDNLFVDIDGARWGGRGRLFQILRGTVDLVIDHNTGIQSGDLIGAAGLPHTRFVFRNNVAPANRGVVGGDVLGYPDPLLTDPLAVLATYFPSAEFTRNALVGGGAASYPPGNFFPSTLAAVGFVDVAGGDYQLAAGSPYRLAGTDGKDLGADVDAIEVATAGVVAGAPPTGDQHPPPLAFTMPAAGATVSGQVTLAASAADDVGVVGVQFTVDGAALGPELTAPPYARTWDTTGAAGGLHQLGAVARDAAGNRTTATLGVTVADVTPPTLSGITVTDVTASSAVVRWTTGEPADSVVRYGPTTAYGSTSASGTLALGHAQTLTGLAPDTLHHYRVSSRDAAGNLATGPDGTFTTRPLVTVTLAAPAAGAVVSGKVTVTATASADAGIASVQFFLDGAPLDIPDGSGPYSVRWTTTRTPNGLHTLTAVARDRLGRTATSPPVTVTVSNRR